MQRYSKHYRLSKMHLLPDFLAATPMVRALSSQGPGAGIGAIARR